MKSTAGISSDERDKFMGVIMEEEPEDKYENSDEDKGSPKFTGGHNTFVES